MVTKPGQVQEDGRIATDIPYGNINLPLDPNNLVDQSCVSKMSANVLDINPLAWQTIGAERSKWREILLSKLAC